MICKMNTHDKNRNYVEVNEIKDFFIQSFIYGFKHILWQVQKEKNNCQNKGLPIVNMN